MLNGCAKKIRGLIQTGRQIGAVNTILYVSDRALATVSGGRARLYKYYFVAQPVSTAARLPGGRGKKLLAREVAIGDEATRHFPRPSSVIAQRYGQGARCIAAFKDETFVGYHWHLHGCYREDEVRAAYLPEPSGAAVWDFDVHVEPGFRLGVAFLRLWDEANAMLAQQGVRWSCSRISAYNAESMKSHTRLAATKMGCSIFLKAGSWQIVFSTIRPYVHLSFRAQSTPVFHFDTTLLAAPARPLQEQQSWRNHAAS